MDNQKLTEMFERIRSGDTDAFTGFYQAYKKPVFTVLWRIVSSKELAEDLTQELFIKLLVNPPDASIHNLRAYVFQMARNLALNALRSHHPAEWENARNHAAQDLSQMDMRLDLDAAISILSDCERQTVTLHLNADLTFLEISQIMGRSLPATYRTYRRALNMLRKTLEGGSI